MLFGFERVFADQPLGIGRNDRRVGKCRAKALAPARRSVVANDLDKHMHPLIKAH